jgi:DNA-binding NarL/FixJ family response regulator
MSEPLTVFLVDDHAVVRRGLVSFLDSEDDLVVVGQADTGRRALSELAVLSNTSRPPDVVLMDVLMPDLDGIQTTTEITQRWPQVRVLVMTSFLEEDRIQAALRAGASGYLLKDAAADDVADAIRRVAAGDVALHPKAARALADAVRAPRLAPGHELTPRERQVVELVAAGRTNQQIATRLGVSERTARTHVSNILTKLGLTSRTQIAMWAVESGVLGPTLPARPHAVHE